MKKTIFAESFVLPLSSEEQAAKVLEKFRR